MNKPPRLQKSLYSTRNELRAVKQPNGFAYIGVLILLAIMGLVSLTALQMGKVVHRRVAEQALLDVGGEFGQALESYRRATPTGLTEQPPSLQELLRDSRFPGVVLHLRKLYDDPMTGMAEWGVIRADDTKGIIGIFSLSTDNGGFY